MVIRKSGSSKQTGKTGKTRKGPDSRHVYRKGGQPYPLEFRVKAVKAVVDRGGELAQVARAVGVASGTLSSWVVRWQQRGRDGLKPTPRHFGDKAGSPRPDTPQRKAIQAAKREHPEHGTRRIRDELARGEGIGVSEALVRRILHEEGLIGPAPAATQARQHGPRRFERAEPNQLWQSDIFTFLLRRHERLYLTAFMDDHSRFLVSHVLAHHQRAPLVLEALERAVAAFGTPQEVLTDNGRQYTTWRGETEFERMLRSYGIRHIKSRPQHPMTLGKVERFWKTLWDEFLSRTVFADFDDCARRLALYIDGYNFQRPHQALDGLVPADRYFRCAPQVRDAVQRGVQNNAMALAHQQPTRKPFYLVGRLGDRELSISAAGSGLRVRVDDDQPEVINLPREETDDCQETPTRIRNAPSDRPTPRPSGEADPEVGQGAAGPGRGGAPALLDGAECPQWRDVGDGGDHESGHFAGDVLPAGDARPARDAACTGPWCECTGPSADRGGEASAGAGAAGEAAGAGEAPCGPALVYDPETGEIGPDESGSRPPEDSAEGPQLDEWWQQTFESLQEAEWAAEAAREDAARSPFDPDQGWRGRALKWDRKLAGADAPPHPAGGGYLNERDEAAQAEEAIRLRAGADAAAAARGALRPGPGRDLGGDQDRARGEARGFEPPPFPDPDAPRPGLDDRIAGTEATWPPTALSARGGAGATGPEAIAPEREAAGPSGHHRPLARCGERYAHGPDGDQQAEEQAQGSTEDDCSGLGAGR
jgi:transposase InsO family protein